MVEEIVEAGNITSPYLKNLGRTPVENILDQEGHYS